MDVVFEKIKSRANKILEHWEGYSDEIKKIRKEMKLSKANGCDSIFSLSGYSLQMKGLGWCVPTEAEVSGIRGNRVDYTNKVMDAIGRLFANSGLCLAWNALRTSFLPLQHLGLLWSTTLARLRR